MKQLLFCCGKSRACSQATCITMLRACLRVVQLLTVHFGGKSPAVYIQSTPRQLGLVLITITCEQRTHTGAAIVMRGE